MVKMVENGFKIAKMVQKWSNCVRKRNWNNENKMDA